MKKLINSFKAKDSNGNLYTIDHYQEFIKTEYISGQSELIPGMESYWCNNSRVNLTGHQEFYIVLLDTHVKQVA